jgi:hypothetical protein
MARPFLLKVQNADPKGHATTLTVSSSATVALIPRAQAASPSVPATLTKPAFVGFAATHAFDPKTRAYVPNAALEAGEYLLVVRDDTGTRSPVVQRLTLTDKQDFLVVSAGWAAPSGVQSQDFQAATVDIVNRGVAPGKGTSPPLQAIVTVKLFPRREFILMSGIETHVGDRFSWRVMPQGRRNILGRRGTIGQGDLVTMLHCESRERLTMLKANKPGKWLVIDTFVKSGTKRTTNNFTVEPKDPVRDIGILDLYGCMDESGRVAPGSVAEVSIFSHAFVKGPVLFNTDDAGIGAKRSANDVDGRAKDWTATETMKSFPSIRSAIASDGLFKVWGCNAARLLHGMLDACERKLPPDFSKTQLFTGDVVLTKARQIGAGFKKQHLTERTTIRHLLSTDVAQQFRDSYVLAAETFLKRPCFGALPGSGSIHPQDQKTKDFRMEIEPGNELAFAFYRRELKAAGFIDDDGRFTRYAPLAKELAASSPPDFTFERFRMFTVATKDPSSPSHQSLLRVASGAQLVAAAVSDDHAFTFRRVDGLVSPGKKGMLFIAALSGVTSLDDFAGVDRRNIFVAPDASRDTGFYMQEDGKLIRLTRPPGAPTSEFAVDDSAIGKGGPKLVGGVLHTASGKFVF